MASKIVLVTGASRGLGKDSVLQLAKKGFDIIFTYQTKKEFADDVVTEIESIGQKAFALSLDISTTADFDQFTVEVKNILDTQFSSAKLDALVNNAGIGINQSFETMTEEIVDLMTNIHFKGPYFLTQKLLPLLN
ncbi:MAG TPA: SDR family NAD(P)-dependent oxidoreductase, partial [Flavobacterium sp.]|nr:SDR family NAD(P)-dependent oxidoreductase [Flavobacterium sp.]